tara:strand:- start:1612 stop:2481 length:870 start_codon:yes stop_codon:yes gene_type:complete
MKKSFFDYDPLAPTPLYEARGQSVETAKLEPSPRTLNETAQAELALKDQHSEALQSRHRAATEAWREEKQTFLQTQEWETQKLRIDGKTLDHTFGEQAKPDQTLRADQVVPPEEKSMTWRESARAQISVEQDRDQAMERHEARWRIHEQQLGAGSMPALTPPGMAEEAGPSMKDKYTEARTRWNDQHDAINEKFDQEKQQERAVGLTLTDLQRGSAANEPAASPSLDGPESYEAPSGEPEITSEPEAGYVYLEDRVVEPHDPSLAEGHAPGLTDDFSLAQSDKSYDRGM